MSHLMSHNIQGLGVFIAIAEDHRLRLKISVGIVVIPINNARHGVALAVD